jgi:hypothetical protein
MHECHAGMSMGRRSTHPEACGPAAGPRMYDENQKGRSMKTPVRQYVHAPFPSCFIGEMFHRVEFSLQRGWKQRREVRWDSAFERLRDHRVDGLADERAAASSCKKSISGMVTVIVRTVMVAS